MSGAKPFEGFASRTEAVLHFKGMGHSNRAIAARLDIEPKTVSALISSHARRKTEGGSRRDAAISGLFVPQLVRSDLRYHAARRNLSIDRLILELLDRIAADDLVDAIMDDQPRAAQQ